MLCVYVFAHRESGLKIHWKVATQNLWNGLVQNVSKMGAQCNICIRLNLITAYLVIYHNDIFWFDKQMAMAFENDRKQKFRWSIHTHTLTWKLI